VPYVQESFSNAAEALLDWSAGYDDTPFEVTPGQTFLVSNRRNANQDGPSLDIGRVRDCLIPDQTYLFSARVRFSSNTATNGTPTTCARIGSSCLRLSSIARFNSGTIGRGKGAERQSDYYTYGEWHNFHTSFTFESNELETSDLVLHKLTLTGPESDVNIEIDDVTFALPPPSVVPDPEDVCGGNLLMNGDAEASAFDPYPMEKIGRDSRLLVMSGDSKFFRTDHRTSKRDSVANYIDAPGCIVPGARYKIFARIRVLSAEPVEASIIFRTLFQDASSSKIVVADCPSSQSDWVYCESFFTVVDDFDADHVEHIRFSFETPTTSLDSFDVDDWNLELDEVFKPSIIVQEEGVSGCWGSGAEILITSHTTDFESSQQRHLVADPEPYADGLVRLRLNDFIVPSVTEQDGDGFAVEVALLSRNVVFEGAEDRVDERLGGHLIVFRTPDLPQQIQGVEIRNFGRQGKFFQQA